MGKGQILKNAVFMDRDGTIIEDKGYLKSPEDVAFYPNAVEAMIMLQENFDLFIVTNQNGISKGLITMENVKVVNAHILEFLEENGIKIRDVFVCPHKREEGCECIKPKPYFANLAAKNHGISLENSFSMGDHPHDMEFGINFGGSGLFVLTGHGTKHKDEIKYKSLIFKDILEAAKYTVQIVTDKNGITGCHRH